MPWAAPAGEEERDAENGERQRDLVRDHLRARAHRAEERVLRLASPAADDERVDPERREREEKDERDRDVQDPSSDLVAGYIPAGAEGDDGERCEGGEPSERRHRDVELVDRRGRVERLLPEQLHEVRDRLEEPERPHSIRTVATLHPAEQLPLQP